MSDPNTQQTNSTSDDLGDDMNVAVEKFERRAQAVLRDSVDHLDGRTLSRLTQARYAALEAAKTRSPLWHWKWLAPVTATAAATVLSITLINNSSRVSQPNMASNLSELSIADLPDKLEIIAAEDSLEFYRDVDFYAWLDTELDEDGNAVPEQSPATPQSEA